MFKTSVADSFVQYNQKKRTKHTSNISFHYFQFSSEFRLLFSIHCEIRLWPGVVKLQKMSKCTRKVGPMKVGLLRLESAKALQE